MPCYAVMRPASMCLTIRSAARAAGGSWHSYLPDFRVCTGQSILLMTSESVGMVHISMAVLW
ncbi:hypothetical protein BKG84_12055 [Mycobacteroides chelonae]|uniref:Uncharacterized protein n=1 Tax=Mycobacteroides chelonae TaxID=1774 RepID=A0A1S1M5X7_MYCCH|nr:hypothetical protein BKG84_12055 [Mycobacteroides chelonae]